MPHSRPAAVAGMFYPDNAEQLTQHIDDLLSSVPPHDEHNLGPSALIVPHAGTIYSGPIAASAYTTLVGSQDRYRAVVLFGPSHRVPFSGMAVPEASTFEIPGATLFIDTDLFQRASSFQGVIASDKPHQLEHSLEVQLPFLWTIFGSIPILPIAVGHPNQAQLAKVIDALWTDDILLVISTDLSHYLVQSEANEVDRRTADAIGTLDPSQLSTEHACGIKALSAFLHTARLRNARIVELDLRTSADTAGTPERVVGYGAWSIYL